MAIIRSILFSAIALLLFTSSEVGEKNEYRNYFDLSPEEFFRLDVAKQRVNLEDPDNDLAAVSVFHATNMLRDMKGKKTLKPSYSLYLAGLAHIEEMRRHNFFGHYNNHNRARRTIRQRIEEQGGNYYIVGENLAKVHPFSTGDIQYTYRKYGGRYAYFDKKGRPLKPMTYGQLGKSVVTDWYRSKGHKENLLDTDFQYLGVAIVIVPNGFRTQRLPDVYAAQEFGAY